MSFRQILAGVATLVAIVAVGAGFFILGSPSEERARQMDHRRVEDLGRIARMIDLYKTRHRKLPAALEELSKEPGAGVNIRDPKTNQVYEYRVLNAGRYELCAGFERDSVMEPYFTGDFWSHKAGRQCFQLEVKEVRR